MPLLQQLSDISSEEHPFSPEEKPEIWQGKGAISGEKEESLKFAKSQNYEELQCGSAQKGPGGCSPVVHGGLVWQSRY